MRSTAKHASCSTANTHILFEGLESDQVPTYILKDTEYPVQGMGAVFTTSGSVEPILSKRQKTLCSRCSCNSFSFSARMVPLPSKSRLKLVPMLVAPFRSRLIGSLQSYGCHSRSPLIFLPVGLLPPPMSHTQQNTGSTSCSCTPRG